MEDAKTLYESIADDMVTAFGEVTYGKMMSSPAITINKKVFAFYYKEKMVFKLGKGFEPESLGILDYELLNPFKNKPPLAGWFVIDLKYADKWKKLANIAYTNFKVAK